MKIQNYLAVFSGGMLGASLRAGLGQILPGLTATTLVNLLGSLALAWLTFGLMRGGHLREWLSLGLGTGMIGAFTTYSTFAVMTLTNGFQGLIFAGMNLICGFLCAGLGYLLANRGWSHA